MVIIVLSGGIGAQLSQFAAGYSEAEKNNSILLIDISWYYSKNKFATKPFTLHKLLDLKKYFFIKNIWISRFIRSYFLTLDFISFRKFKYKRINIINPLKYKKITKFKNLFLNGYFQNIDYFSNNLDKILKLIQINDNNEKDKITLGIHVRKGDQKNGPNDFLTSIYYNAALNKIIKNNKINLNKLKIFVFCEELSWPKKNLKFKYKSLNLTYIIGNDRTAIRDLKKMMKCSHIIISNSSYSWWAAAYISLIKGGTVACPDLWWLRTPAKKINIYPKNWNMIKTNIIKNKNFC